MKEYMVALFLNKKKGYKVYWGNRVGEARVTNNH